MENSASLVFNSEDLEIKNHISIIDDIIQLKRQKENIDTQKDITNEEREILLKQALGTYRLLSKKSLELNGKVLIEYRQGLHKIVEEVIL
jgi:hypothetical protein